MLDMPMTRLSSLIIDPTINDSAYQGLWIPALTQLEINAIPTSLTSGQKESAVPILFNYDTSTYQILNRAVWENLFSCSTIASGAGLTAGSPLVLAEGNPAEVEAEGAGNLTNGFMYYSEPGGRVRGVVAGAWGTFTFVPD